VTSRSVREKKNPESHRASHRKDMSPLTQGLNYRSACDERRLNGFTHGFTNSGHTQVSYPFLCSYAPGCCSWLSTWSRYKDIGALNLVYILHSAGVYWRIVCARAFMRALSAITHYGSIHVKESLMIYAYARSIDDCIATASRLCVLECWTFRIKSIARSWDLHWSLIPVVGFSNYIIFSRLNK